MTKIEYYKQIKSYSRVSLFARELDNDESFQKSKSKLSQTISRMITMQLANMIEREHRLAKHGYMIVFNQQDHDLLNKLNDLKNKIDYNQPITKSDYENTYVKQVLIFGLSLEEASVLVCGVIIFTNFMLQLISGV